MSKNPKDSLHEYENHAAERLVKEFESPLGAKKLGDEAYELVKQELASK
ncbi:MAG: hypothetical protein AAF669_05370 [Pseudomonadota bacterium]